MHVPAVFEMPEGQRVRLEIAPRLESWNRSDHPDQVRLRAFVAHVRERIDPVAKEIEGPLAFWLDVGLAESTDPLWQRDLDNYLFPIARELPARYVSIWGTKGRRRDSFVTVSRARAVTPPEWPSHRVPRALGSETAWKQAVRDAVAEAEPIPPGPVAMQLSLTVGSGRSWTAMWKRTIDGLDALLGRTYPDREWNPQDGRIVRLGLHVRTEHAFNHDVETSIWARPADLDWPELRWLVSLEETERVAYLAAHTATVHQVAGRGARSPAAAPTGPRHARAQRVRRGRPPSPMSIGLTEVKTEEAFENAVEAGVLMLKTDTARPPTVHTQPARCSGITKENFRTKVMVGGGKNGRYFTLTDPAVAKQRWARVIVCGVCQRLDPAGAAAVDTAINDTPAGRVTRGS